MFMDLNPNSFICFCIVGLGKGRLYKAANKDSKVNYVITLIPTFKKDWKNQQKPSKKCLNCGSHGYSK